jgi:hypothetical protein
MTPVIPPSTKIIRPASPKSNGVRQSGRPFQSVATQPTTCIPVGIAITVLAAAKQPIASGELLDGLPLDPEFDLGVFCFEGVLQEFAGPLVRPACFEHPVDECRSAGDLTHPLQIGNARLLPKQPSRFELPLLGSNQDSPDPGSCGQTRGKVTTAAP